MYEILKGIRKAFAVMMVLTAFSLVYVSAQATTAAITGRLVDEQNNVIPGAKVTATDKSTGQMRSVMTNGDGDFTIAELNPGSTALPSNLKISARH